MDVGSRGGPWKIPDPKEMLDALLDRLDDALQQTRAAANGMPIFAVEAELTGRFHAVLPRGGAGASCTGHPGPGQQGFPGGWQIISWLGDDTYAGPDGFLGIEPLR